MIVLFSIDIFLFSFFLFHLWIDFSAVLKGESYMRLCASYSGICFIFSLSMNAMLWCFRDVILLLDS